jgi:Na+/H+ antiporter NhaC
MAAASAGTAPLEHFYTQAPYAIPPFIATIVAFIVSGFLASYSGLFNAGISMLIGITICFGLLIFLNKNKRS